MLQKYLQLNKADKYIIGFTVKNIVYMVVTDTIKAEYIKPDKASRNGGQSLRLNIVKQVKQDLMAIATAIGTTDQLKAGKYNKGENFERLVYGYYNQEWYKDNTPFTQGGDIKVNDMEIQIKFHRATLVNEKTMVSLLK